MKPTLGAKLRTLRTAHNLTQKGLARHLRAHHIHISQQSVSLYERDVMDPPAAFLRACAEYYRVSLDWLVPTNLPCDSSPKRPHSNGTASH